jgi:histidinol dehydrogenase
MVPASGRSAMPTALTFPIVVEGSPAFEAALHRIIHRGAEDMEAVTPAVRDIIAEVRRSGAAAVRRYVEAFERRKVDALVREVEGGESALARLAPDVRAGLTLAAERIARYHEHQREDGFLYEEEGIALGMRVRPLKRVGVYAPGGKARYPSTVLMTAIPARIAGVKDIVLATPAPDDRLLAAAHLAGVTSILDAGGAQAIAALAYGIEGLPRVDKIVGPGNLYVTAAKRLVYGDVDIDGIAGPSEILVLADELADPALCAADLLSQAEHDEAASAILLTTSQSLAEAVAEEAAKQLEALSRPAIIEASIAAHGAILVVSDRARLIELADAIGAEHLALHVEDADELLSRTSVAGAALVGAATPVAAGDYLAGPSHVLPTGGAVRFGSPLGVYDFIARSSVIRYSTEAIRRHGPHIAALARAEGLDAHARAVELRMERLSPADKSKSGT